jgi:hypothetical protein
MAASLSKALPGNPMVSVVDSSMDESRLLILAGGDVDPGVAVVDDVRAEPGEPVDHPVHGVLVAGDERGGHLLQWPAAGEPPGAFRHTRNLTAGQ